MAITYIADTNFRNESQRFGIKDADRRSHMYISGKTGGGKTTLMHNLMMQDIENGHGIAFIDPHGDESLKLLREIPPWRYNDVVYFDPQDPTPIGINVLDLPVESVISAFRSIWKDSWGARLEYILFHSLNSCKQAKQTLLGVVRMLVDEPYREKIVALTKDPVTRNYWNLEYAAYGERLLSEAISPIQNKATRFLSEPIRYVFGQATSSIDIRYMMDNNKIFIANISSGANGDDTSNLTGSLLISMFKEAAFSRENIEEKDRKDFFLYVDEFQNFTTESFTTILSQARKYHLCLTLAHQYIDQLTEAIRFAVFGNVGTLVTFRSGNRDAEFLAGELGVAAPDLQELPAFNIYIKLLIDGQQSRAFSAKTYTVPRPVHDPTNLLKDSRARYGRPDAKRRIASWLSQ